MPPAIRVNDSSPPIVLTVFTGRQEPVDVEPYFERMEEIQARRQKYIGISFMLRYRTNTEQLARVGKWIKQTEATVKELCVCNAIVAPNVGFRFVMSGLMLIQPMPIPYEIVADVDAAADWVEEFLRTHPMAPPLGMRRYLDEQMQISRRDLAENDAAAR